MGRSMVEAEFAPREGSLAGVSALAGTAARRTQRSASLALRALLMLGCAVAIGAVALWASPAAYLQSDPDLARLLRGMALIKTVLVLGAVIAVAWRFGHRISAPLALAYLFGSWTLTAATLMVWELTLIPLAAVAFHAALVGVLVAAWRDDGRAKPARE